MPERGAMLKMKAPEAKKSSGGFLSGLANLFSGFGGGSAVSRPESSSAQKSMAMKKSSAPPQS